MSPPTLPLNLRWLLRWPSVPRPADPLVTVTMTVESWRILLRHAGLGLTARTPHEEWKPVTEASRAVREEQMETGGPWQMDGGQPEACECCGLLVERLGPGELRFGNVCRTCTARGM